MCLLYVGPLLIVDQDYINPGKALVIHPGPNEDWVISGSRDSTNQKANIGGLQISTSYPVYFHTSFDPLATKPHTSVTFHNQEWIKVYLMKTDIQREAQMATGQIAVSHDWVIGVFYSDTISTVINCT